MYYCVNHICKSPGKMDVVREFESLSVKPDDDSDRASNHQP